jgi:Raf kinase inhibitor-like YbhB/YbcL family protein
MRARAVFAIFLIASAGGILASAPAAGTEPIVLRSASFPPGGRISSHFASRECGGDNFSVPLWWRRAPPLTQSFLVTVFDAQGRSGAGLWHWVVYDIASTANGIASSADGRVLPPKATTATNGHGLRGYSGPCPPKGETHRYLFTIYALDEPFVQEKKTVAPRHLLADISSHVLATGTLVGTYSR